MTVPSLDDHATGLAFLTAHAERNGLSLESARSVARDVISSFAKHPYGERSAKARLAAVDALIYRMKASAA